VIGKDNGQATPVQNESIDPQRDILIFELIKGRPDNEWRRINDLDSKANNLVGFVSVVISLLLGATAFKLSSALKCNIDLSILYFIGIGLLLAQITRDSNATSSMNKSDNLYCFLWIVFIR
jgi:hypothetical protein